jgi:hypothetical protein
MSTTDYFELPGGGGYWQKKSDGTGPYVQGPAGTFTLAGTGGGGGGGGGAVTMASGAVASGAYASGSIASGAIVDGADVTQGAIADVAVTAGASGSVSAKLRSISRDIGTVAAAHGAQATAVALAVSVATDDALMGTANDAAITAGATGTNSAKLRSISRDIGTVAGAVSGSRMEVTSTGRRVRLQVTRPANTTAYTAGDVIGTGSTAALTFASLGPASKEIFLTSIDLTHEVTAVPAGMTSFRLHLYNATPPSALADNAAWDLPSGDLTNYMGYVDFGVIADVGSNLFVQVDNTLKQVTTDASGNVYGYLVTNGGWTPGANSTVFDISLRSVEA